MMKYIKYALFYLAGILTIPAFVMIFTFFVFRNPSELLDKTFPDSSSLEAEVVIELDKPFDAKSFRDLKTKEILERMDSLFTSEKEVLRPLLNSDIPTKITLQSTKGDLFYSSSFKVSNGMSVNEFESSKGSILLKYVDVDVVGFGKWIFQKGSIQQGDGGDT